MQAVVLDYCHSACELTRVNLLYLFCLYSLNSYTGNHVVSSPNLDHFSFYLVNLPQAWTLCYGLGRGALFSHPLVTTAFRWCIRLPLPLRGGSCSRALRQGASATHRNEQRSQHDCNQQYVNHYAILTKLIQVGLLHSESIKLMTQYIYLNDNVYLFLVSL